MIKKEFIPRNYVEVKEGDIAFADASEDTNDVAKAIEFLSTDEIPTICGLHTIHGRDKLKLTELGYKGYYFSSDAFHNQVKKRAQGTKIFSVSPKLLSECRISIPSKLEQKKIASLLLTIDERIATQSKIIEKLQSLMDGLKNKLLSQHFLDEKIKLSELGILKNGYAFKSSSYVPLGKYNVVTISNVSGDRFVTGNFNHLATLPTDIQPHQILFKKEILISLTGNVGRVSLNHGENNLLNQRVGLFHIPQRELHEFIYQCLSSPSFEASMRQKAQGAAQMNIGKNDIEEYEIPFSSDFELIKKVSSLLYSLDQRLIVAKDLNEIFLVQKLYLLKHMFI